MILSSFGIPQPALKVVVSTGNIVFLHPREFPELDATVPDPLVRGTITLNLPRPKEVRSIVAKLIADYKVNYPSGYQESGRIVSREMKVPLSFPTLDKGDHSFEFELPVPMNSAPYESNRYGSILHRIIVEAKGPSLNIEAIKEIDLAVNPVEEGTPLDLTLDLNGFNEQIGLYAMTASSHHFTVAGLLNFRFSIPCVPNPLSIHRITAAISESIHLHSFTDPSKSVLPPPHQIQLICLDATRPPSYASCPNSSLRTIGGPVGVLAVLDEGEGYEAKHSIRLPNGEMLRPTTQPGSNTPFRTSHELCIDVTFQEKGQTAKTLKLRRPIVIPSCCCTLDSLLVPSYSATDPLPKSRRLLLAKLDSIPTSKRKRCEMACACGFTYEVLLEQQALSLLAANKEAGDGDGILPKKWEYGITLVESNWGE